MSNGITWKTKIRAEGAPVKKGGGDEVAAVIVQAEGSKSEAPKE